MKMLRAMISPRRARSACPAALAGPLCLALALLPSMSCQTGIPHDDAPTPRAAQVDINDGPERLSLGSCDGPWAPELALRSSEPYLDVSSDLQRGVFALATASALEIWELTGADAPRRLALVPATELGPDARWLEVTSSRCDGGFFALGETGVGDGQRAHVALIHDRAGSLDGPEALSPGFVPVSATDGAPGDLKDPGLEVTPDWRIRELQELALTGPAAHIASSCARELVVAGARGLAFATRDADGDLRATGLRSFDELFGEASGAVTSLALLPEGALVGFSTNAVALVPRRPEGPLELVSTHATPRAPLVLGNSVLLPETRSGWSVDPGELDERQAADADAHELQGPGLDLSLRSGWSPEPPANAFFELFSPDGDALTLFGEAPWISAFDAHDGPFEAIWLNNQLIVANSESGLLRGRLDGAGVELDLTTQLTSSDWPELPARPQALASLDDLVVTIEPGQRVAAVVRVCS